MPTAPGTWSWLNTTEGQCTCLSRANQGAPTASAEHWIKLEGSLRKVSTGIDTGPQCSPSECSEISKNLSLTALLHRLLSQSAIRVGSTSALMSKLTKEGLLWTSTSKHWYRRAVFVSAGFTGPMPLASHGLASSLSRGRLVCIAVHRLLPCYTSGPPASMAGQIPRPHSSTQTRQSDSNADCCLWLGSFQMADFNKSGIKECNPTPIRSGAWTSA